MFNSFSYSGVLVFSKDVQFADDHIAKNQGYIFTYGVYSVHLYVDWYGDLGLPQTRGLVERI